MSDNPDKTRRETNWLLLAIVILLIIIVVAIFKDQITLAIRALLGQE